MNGDGPAPWAEEVHAALGVGGFRPSAVVHGGGWNVAIDASVHVPAASLIKLPVLAALALAVHEEGLDLAERLAVPPSAVAGGAGVLRLLHPEQSWRLDDLAVLMIGISDNTVKNHLKSIMEKLHVENRVQAVAYALEDRRRGPSPLPRFLGSSTGLSR